MVTTSPVLPADGLTEAIIGSVVLNVNPSRLPGPIGVVTVIAPDVPEATTAVITDGDITANEAAGVPPKLTDVAPVKFNPLIVTTVPVLPATGENDEMIGPV